VGERGAGNPFLYYSKVLQKQKRREKNDTGGKERRVSPSPKGKYAESENEGCSTKGEQKGGKTIWTERGLEEVGAL